MYAADWRDGKPVAGSPGQSHMFQYIRLESYEDTLNNVRFRRAEGAGPARGLRRIPDYILRYMLDFETAGSPSLLDPAQFERPFDYQLDITRRRHAPHAVDLVTTFNFLLGLRVRTFRRFRARRPPCRSCHRRGRRGRRVCVLWRNIPPLEDMEAEGLAAGQHALEGWRVRLLYVNGECALPGALPIEPDFSG